MSFLVGMGLHSEEFAPLKKQGFQVCDDARRQRGREVPIGRDFP